MESITVKVAVFQSTRFGFRVVGEEHFGVHSDMDYVRVSEFVEVAFPSIQVDMAAVKAAELEAKRASLTQQLWDVEAEQTALLQQQEAERQAANERRLGHGWDHDDDSEDLTDDNTDFGEAATCTAELNRDAMEGR